MHKVIEIYGKINIFRNWTEVTPRQPSCTPSHTKVTSECVKVTRKVSGSLVFSQPWRPQARLDPSTYVGEMSIFCLWARLGRTQGDMICIASAIRRLYAPFCKNRQNRDFGMPKSSKWRFWHAKISKMAVLACQNHQRLASSEPVLTPSWLP